MDSAVARVEAAARKRGWRVRWETSPWPMFGWRIRSLHVIDGDRVRAAAATTIGRDGTVESASERCAAMLLERAA